MTGDRKENNRRSIRLKGYDYSKAGAYYVTICVRQMRCLFGGIVEGRVELNVAGRIVAESWEWLAVQYDYVELDEFVIMPNHMHAVLVIGAGAFAGGSGLGGSRAAPTAFRTGQTSRMVRLRCKPLGSLIGAFKTVSTRRINELRGTPGEKLWQRNYWERVVRDDMELAHLREYIRNNPMRWGMDRLHPDRGTGV